MTTLGDAKMNDLTDLLLRAAGSLLGVLLSMIFVPPQNTRATWYRVLFATPAGFIFARPAQHVLWFLAGDGWENTMPAALAAGFVVWFVLEGVARMMASQQWIEWTLQEILRIRNGRKPKD